MGQNVGHSRGTARDAAKQCRPRSFGTTRGPCYTVDVASRFPGPRSWRRHPGSLRYRSWTPHSGCRRGGPPRSLVRPASHASITRAGALRRGHRGRGWQSRGSELGAPRILLRRVIPSARVLGDARGIDRRSQPHGSARGRSSHGALRLDPAAPARPEARSLRAPRGHEPRGRRSRRYALVGGDSDAAGLGCPRHGGARRVRAASRARGFPCSVALSQTPRESRRRPRAHSGAVSRRTTRRPSRSRGTMCLRMSERNAALPPITARWKISWYPKTRGTITGQRNSSASAPTV